MIVASFGGALAGPVHAGSAWYAANDTYSGQWHLTGGYWYYHQHNVVAGGWCCTAWAARKVSGGSWNFASASGEVQQNFSSTPPNRLACMATFASFHTKDIDCGSHF